ncbi:hypothetical protein PG993_006900 [Apiospora rasikravindrae]|uniref:J domain-containing protein n=1 Tax=Apiospora rasikravindrae TaxID=990691 RepID=A0ABR1SVY3_9PEZI
MSSANSFDYYAELGVEPTASPQVITAAYRRLALARHPDRNPDDPTATASFQRVSPLSAYETLGDPGRKASYDASRTRTRTRAPWEPARPYNYDQPTADYGFGFENFTDSIFEAYIARVLETMARERAAFAAAARRQAEAEAQRRRQEEQRREEQERRELEKQQRREAENRLRAAKKEEAAREAAAKIAAEKSQASKERAQQERRWTLYKAITSLDKRDACLHSQYDGWTKESHPRKLKCEECGGKRSMTTFGCPYCEIKVCPMCREKLARAKRESQE